MTDSPLPKNCKNHLGKTVRNLIYLCCSTLSRLDQLTPEIFHPQLFCGSVLSGPKSIGILASEILRKKVRQFLPSNSEQILKELILLGIVRSAKNK